MSTFSRVSREKPFTINVDRSAIGQCKPRKNMSVICEDCVPLSAKPEKRIIRICMFEGGDLRALDINDGALRGDFSV
jgi:hypothetical protein